MNLINPQENRSVVARVDRKLTAKEHKGTFGDEGNVLHYGGSYTGI